MKDLLKESRSLDYQSLNSLTDARWMKSGSGIPRYELTATFTVLQTKFRGKVFDTHLTDNSISSIK